MSNHRIRLVQQYLERHVDRTQSAPLFTKKRIRYLLAAVACLLWALLIMGIWRLRVLTVH